MNKVDTQKATIDTLNSQVQFGKYNLISNAPMPPHALTPFPYNNSEVILTMGI